MAFDFLNQAHIDVLPEVLFTLRYFDLMPIQSDNNTAKTAWQARMTPTAPVGSLSDQAEATFTLGDHGHYDATNPITGIDVFCYTGKIGDRRVLLDLPAISATFDSFQREDGLVAIQSTRTYLFPSVRAIAKLFKKGFLHMNLPAKLEMTSMTMYKPKKPAEL